MAAYPASRGEDRVETLHGVQVADPFRWLEDGEAEETRAWTAAQNGYTRQVLDALPQRGPIRERLDQLLTVGAVSCPVQRGSRFFYTRRDGRQDQPVLLVRESVEGPEQVLLDPNALSQAGLVALDWWYPSRDGSLLAYGTSEGGTELSTLRVRNVATGEDLADTIPHTRAASVAWPPDNSGFYYTSYPAPGSVPAGDEFYFRTVFFHRLGTDWQDDGLVFGEDRAREDWPNVYLSRDGRWLTSVVSQGWAKSEVWLLDRFAEGAEWVPVFVEHEALADGYVENGILWLHTNLDAPNYRLYAVDPVHPVREQWREVIPERSDRVLSNVRPVGGMLAAEELRNATSRLALYALDGGALGEIDLPTLGTLTGIGGEWESDALYFGFTSFAQPASSYRVDLTAKAVEPFASGSLPPGVDPSTYAVRQVWYPSGDGTQVSMFLVHRPDVPLSGDNPTLLTGYGGFNVSRTPAFEASLPLWLDAGGVYALPNLRGGGEYGETWHQQGMLDRKQNVFDDFIAAAEWLIANHYTRPERLAIRGGSNGGLLVGAVEVQRPDLFKAVVCQVPLLDMLRYQTFRIARLWVAEYGSADDPDQLRYLHAYSPYHRVQPGTAYPATFLLTAEGDSRVDPMHARKMAALLQTYQAADAPILLRVEEAAGHGQGKPRSKVLDEGADVWAFLFWQLGVALDG